jgi:hypothetical protein
VCFIHKDRRFFLCPFFGFIKCEQVPERSKQKNKKINSKQIMFSFDFVLFWEENKAYKLYQNITQFFFGANGITLCTVEKMIDVWDLFKIVHHSVYKISIGLLQVVLEMGLHCVHPRFNLILPVS